jgi:hypothetical protein
MKVSGRCKYDLDNPNADIYLRGRSIFRAAFIRTDLDQLQLVERKQKWVLYDEAGYVVIIASDLNICRNIMKRMQNERSNSRQAGVPAQ